ncbi:MAG: type VI secretion system baseplate subunit TssG, partial [Colwellia sp.]
MSYDLEQKIIDAPYDYNFFQAAHLIERYLVDSKNRSFRYAGNQNGALVFQTDNSIAFPGSDVVSIKKNSQSGAYTLNLSFMGLYGVSSPLPSYFTEPLNRGREEFEPLRKFLDIFSHRIYSLFYQTWKKYRYQIQINAQSIDDYSKALFSLTGLGFRSNHAPTSKEYKQEMATVPLAKLMMGK